jgi:acetyl-CoA synthetase
MTLQIKSLEEYNREYQRSIASPDEFWAEQAETFSWDQKWDEVLEWDFTEPRIRWFINGKLNITINCLDRHLKTRGDQTAIIWEPNDPKRDNITYTYRELYHAVCKAANALKSLGIEKGDRVCFYMPMVPELAIGLLACARIGAIHSVVFAGFSQTSLADRIKDAQCKLVICSDFNERGSKFIPVKAVVDEALDMGCDSVKHVIIHRNTGDDISWTPDRDIWWHRVVDAQLDVCAPVMMDSEDVLFILYTSGSTGQPKGVVHTCGGYMVYTSFSFRNVFQYEDGDVYWCTADVGWITGHSYIVYGPLLSGATQVMFEGVPTRSMDDRFSAIGAGETPLPGKWIRAALAVALT